MKRFVKLLAAILCFALISAMAPSAYAAESDHGSVISISACRETSAAVTADGSLWIWGEVSGGGMPYSVFTPTRIMDNVREVFTINCAREIVVKNDDTLWVVNNPATISETATATQVDNDVRSIVYSPGTIAVIKNDNTFWYSESVQNINFKKIADDVDKAYVSTDGIGGCSYLFLKNDGTLWIKGYGLFGDGQDYVYEYRSAQQIMDNVREIAAYGFSYAAVRTDNSLWMWGRDTNNRFFGENAGKDLLTPVKVMDNVSKVRMDIRNTAVIKTDNTLWVWGDNFGGQTGNGAHGDKEVQLTPFKALEGVVEVSCGMYHTLAITTDGSLYAWGYALKGGIGVGDNRPTFELSPVKVFEGGNSQPAQGVFSDVSTTDYYYDAVVWAKENGITDGVGNNQFAPSAPIDRAQMVTFLWKLNGRPGHSATAINPFADVKESDWYYDAVMWAKENGVTDGTSATTFSPEFQVDRATAVTFLWKQAGSPNKADNGAWYDDAINWAENRSMLSGTAETFSAKASCPRCDIVFYMYKDALLQ